MSCQDPEVVTTVARCRQIVSELLENSVIAVDAEGVQLGKKGPMTLLQIGTMSKTVYLFDVQENKDLFTKGKLRMLLEAEDVLKVTHSCSGDSAALFHQFEGIKLSNVFDTQVAHLLLEENSGRRIPRSLKLQMLCEKYANDAQVSDNKSEIKNIYSNEIGDFWAMRPLTKEMMEYAAGDVVALIPEVYEALKHLIELNGLWKEFESRVEEEIMLNIKHKYKSQRDQRTKEVVIDIMEEFDTKYDESTPYTDITDEDDITALKLLSNDEAQDFSPLVYRLKIESINAYLKNIERQIDDEGADITVKGNPAKYLFILMKHPEKDIRKEAKRLRDRLTAVLGQGISRKYTMDTDLQLVSKGDKDVLRSIRHSGKNSPFTDEVQERLYWLVMEQDVDNQTTRFQKLGKKFTITEPNYNKLKFLSQADRPPFVKNKAKDLIRKINRKFGRGRVPFQYY